MKNRIHASLSYFFSKTHTFPQGRVMNLSEFTLPWWDDSRYMIYANDCIRQEGDQIILRTERIPDPEEFMQRQGKSINLIEYYKKPPFLTEEIKQARIVRMGSLVPYSHYAGGLISKAEYTPPFHVQMTVDLPYATGLLPSVWCYHCKARTEEFDFFETENGDIKFTQHYSPLPNWDDRKMDQSFLLWQPEGTHTIDFDLTKTKAVWYLDGKRIKCCTGDFDLPYLILATLIVTDPECPETEMKIKLTIT